MLLWDASIESLGLDGETIRSHRSKSWVNSSLAIKYLFKFGRTCFAENRVILMAMRFHVLEIRRSNWRIIEVIVFDVLVITFSYSCPWRLNTENAFKSKFCRISCRMLSLLFQLSLELFRQNPRINKLIKSMMIEIKFPGVNAIFFPWWS